MFFLSSNALTVCVTIWVRNSKCVLLVIEPPTKFFTLAFPLKVFVINN